MTTANIETEAKFGIPNKDTFRALKDTFEANGTGRLGQFQLKPAGVKTMTDRYFDVADKRLLKAGYACRIRTVKQKQTLTIKSLTPAQGHVHRRQEIEMAVESGYPWEWAEGPAKTLVLSIIGRATPETLFTLRQTRQKFTAFYQKLPVIELSLDEVWLGDTHTVDYFELEAELIAAGTEDDLTRFIAVLQANWPLQPEHKSKFERALAQTNF